MRKLPHARKWSRVTSYGHECFVVIARERPQCRLSGQAVSSRLCTVTRSRNLTLTSAHVLVRAPMDGPGPQPTGAGHALVPTLPVHPTHVCHRQETGLSPWARTRSRTQICGKRLHLQAHRCLHVKSWTSITSFQKNNGSYWETVVICAYCNACFPRAGRHLQGSAM